MKTIRLLRLGPLLVATLSAPSFAWGLEAFLWVDGIPGEAVQEQHKGWVELTGMTNRADRPAGPASQKDAIQWIVLKHVDKATPLLYQACAQGQPVAQALIELVLGEPTSLRFYQITLSNVVFESISSSATAGASHSRGASVKKVQLRAEWVHWSYTVFRPQSGLPTQQIASFWDQVRKTGGSTNHKPLFTVSGIQKEGGQVLLTWPGHAGQRYRIFSSGSVKGPYSPKTEVTALRDGPMSYTASSQDPLRFFVVEQR